MPIATHKESEQIATRLSPKELEEIERLVKMGFYMNTADFVRQSVREKLESVEVIELRDVSKKKAKEEIIDYMRKHPKCYPSEIADALRVDFDIVLSVVKALIKEGRVQ